jgi:hypothetical protein
VTMNALRLLAPPKEGDILEFGEKGRKEERLTFPGGGRHG